MGDRPNPRNGHTVRPYNPAVQFTQEDLDRVIKSARINARHTVFEELGISNLVTDSTPSSRCIENGEPRHFMEALDQERGSLCLGNHTDDELAAELFLYGDMSSEDKTRALLSGKPSSIAYLMAGKERIRWLSRHLDAALGREQVLLEERAQAKVELDKLSAKLDASLTNEEKLNARIKELEEQVETLQGDLYEAYTRADM